VGEELFLEVFGDPALDDDIIAVTLKSGEVWLAIGGFGLFVLKNMLTSSQSQGKLYAKRVSGSRCLRWT
jgi:hypothetical protein